MDLIDHSTEIAFVQTCIQILEGFEPCGDWQNHTLVRKWRKSTYSLSLREFSNLQKFLAKERDRVTAPKQIESEQLKLT